MIKRIVKMSFELEKVEKFKSIYELNWHKIKGFEGCLHVELLQDRSSPSIFFTYSNWESENHSALTLTLHFYYSNVVKYGIFLCYRIEQNSTEFFLKVTCCVPC